MLSLKNLRLALHPLTLYQVPGLVQKLDIRENKLNFN